VSLPEGVCTNLTLATVRGAQLATTTCTVDSMVRTDRVPAGPTGRRVRCTHTAVTGSARREMSAPELIRTDFAWFNGLGAVISTTSVTGDSIIVTASITARLTRHSVVGANFDVAGSTGPEMRITDCPCTLVTGPGMSVTV
jgi:hypothetical protein